MSLLKNPKSINDFESSSWSLIREDTNKVFQAQQYGKVGSNMYYFFKKKKLEIKKTNSGL